MKAGQRPSNRQDGRCGSYEELPEGSAHSGSQPTSSSRSNAKSQDGSSGNTRIYVPNDKPGDWSQYDESADQPNDVTGAY